MKTLVAVAVAGINLFGLVFYVRQLAARRARPALGFWVSVPWNATSKRRIRSSARLVAGG